VWPPLATSRLRCRILTRGMIKLRYPFFIGSFLLCAVIAILYSVSWGHNFLFDEENIILYNRFIKHAALFPEIFKHGYFPFEEKSDTVWNVYYRPLTSLTFALDYHFWKANPLGYNLVNTFLHSGVSLLLFGVARKALENDWAAFFAALLYSVHTAHTEAVTYIASRGDLLGASFLLLALLAYWHRRDRAALFFYLLGLFAKESVLLLPAYLAVLDFSFVKNDPKTVLKRISPFLAAAFLFLVFRKYLSPAPLGPPTTDWVECFLRFFSMGPAFLNYLQAVAVPEDFKFCLAVDFAKSFLDTRVFLTIGIAALLAAGWLLTERRRGPAFFGMSFFLVSFLPSMQIIHYQPEWAEHYLYLPGMGLAILLGCLIKKIFEARKKTAVAIFFSLYLPFFFFISAKTWQRNAIYNDADLYYERLSKSDSPFASYGYGYKARIAIERGRWKEAIVPLKVANKMNPKQHMTYDWMGLYYFQDGDYSQALENFRKAYKYCSFHNSKHLVKVAMTLFQMGRYPEAARTYEFIQKEHPREAELYSNLLMTYEFLGNPEKARFWIEKGLRNVNGNDKDTAFLTMVFVRLCYRQGWDDLVHSKLDLVLQKYPDVFWYSDVVRLLKGKTSVQEFQALLKLKYTGEEFKSTARLYILMALTLNERWEELRAYVRENQNVLEAQVNDERLFEKEWERARRALEAHPVKAA